MEETKSKFRPMWMMLVAVAFASLFMFWFVRGRQD
jgi:hypothetical protein